MTGVPQPNHPTSLAESHTWYRELIKVQRLVEQGKAIPQAIRLVMANNSKLPKSFNDWVRGAYGLSVRGAK